MAKVFVCIKQGNKPNLTDYPKVSVWTTGKAASRWAAEQAAQKKGLAYDIEEAKIQLAPKGAPKKLNKTAAKPVAAVRRPRKKSNPDNLPGVVPPLF